MTAKIEAETLISTPTLEEVRSGELGRRWRVFNYGFVGEYPETQPVWLNARDTQGALLGGLRGFVFLGWLTIELLFVEQAVRGAGLGSRLLDQAETRGRELGATRARLDTFEWQARDFYVRHGYEEFSRIDDYVGGRWLASMRNALCTMSLLRPVRFGAMAASIAAAWLMLSATVAQAAPQVELAPAEAAAGSIQTLRFRIAAACPDAQRLQGVNIQLPWGFRGVRAAPRPGWQAHVRQAVRKNGPLGWPGDVRWQRVADASPEDGEDTPEFALEARMPPRGEWLGFDLRVQCSGDSTRPDAVARATLRVQTPGAAPVEVSQAWVRATAPEHKHAELFLVLQASTDLRLVDARAPGVGRIAIERTLFGKLRDAQLVQTQQVDLPAGQRVALTPGLAHLALQQLETPLADGAQLPVTLRFEDAAGVVTERTLQVPVRRGPRDGSG